MWLDAADFNGDGRLDALTVVESMDFGGVETLSLGRGDGTFDRLEPFVLPVDATEIATGDFNGDGRPDLAVAGSNYIEGSVTVLLNNGDLEPHRPRRCGSAT